MNTNVIKYINRQPVNIIIPSLQAITLNGMFDRHDNNKTSLWERRKIYVTGWQGMALQSYTAVVCCNKVKDVSTAVHPQLSHSLGL